MRWILVSRGRLTVPNFRTKSYVTSCVTLELKSAGEREGGESLTLWAYKVIRNSNSKCINLAYSIYKQWQISRNALPTKVHCRTLILKHKFNFKTPIFPSLSSILNSLILNKSIKAGLKQPGEGGMGFQCPSSPHKIIHSGKFEKYLPKIF